LFKFKKGKEEKKDILGGIIRKRYNDLGPMT
jgi:hypothetical protein